MSWEIKGDNREPHPAVLLVILVIAVPVSLIGTLAFMLVENRGQRAIVSNTCRVRSCTASRKANITDYCSLTPI